MLELADARATLDVTTRDHEIRIGKTRRAAVADKAKQARAQERIRTVDRGGVVEVAGLRNLRRRLVVHGHELRIDRRMLVEIVVQERAAGITLFRALKVIQSAVVEERQLVRYQDTARSDRPHVGAEDEVRRKARRGSRTRTFSFGRARPGEISGTRRASGPAILRFQDRQDIAVSEVDRRITVIVGRVQAANEGDGFLRARPDIAVRNDIHRRGLTRAEGLFRFRHPLNVRVVILIDARVGDQFHAFKMIVELEVDDAGRRRPHRRSRRRRR